MISTFTKTNHAINALGATVTAKPCKSGAEILSLPVAQPVKHIGKTALENQSAEARPANHNLSRSALKSNVVVLGRIQTTDDFPPDMGARPALAA